MSKQDYSCPMLQDATENDDGDLIYTKTVTGPAGSQREIEVNCTTMYAPGRRKSGNVELLVIEAELAADGVELGNPAFPIREEIADQVHARLDEDVDPAWMTCTPREFP